MKRFSVFLVFLLCQFGTLHAQDKKSPIVVWAADTPDERGSTRVVFWDRMNRPLGEIAVDYGRPKWLPAYEDAAKFDAFTKNQTWRLGSNYWTTLDTNVPIKIANKQIPVGLWYLGLYRSADGATWSLAFMDPAKVRKALVDAIQIEKAPIEFEVPITVDQMGAGADKLTIVLSDDKQNPENGSLKIMWGKWRMTAPIQVPLP